MTAHCCNSARPPPAGILFFRMAGTLEQDVCHVCHETHTVVVFQCPRRTCTNKLCAECLNTWIGAKPACLICCTSVGKERVIYRYPRDGTLLVFVIALAFGFLYGTMMTIGIIWFWPWLFAK